MWGQHALTNALTDIDRKSQIRYLYDSFGGAKKRLFEHKKGSKRFLQEILSNPHPRQAWDLIAGCSWFSDSLNPATRFLGSGLLKVFFCYSATVAGTTSAEPAPSETEGALSGEPGTDASMDCSGLESVSTPIRHTACHGR